MPALAAVCVVSSIYAAVCLHGAPTRAHVVSLLPAALVWGALVSWACPRMPSVSAGAALALAMAVRLPLIGTPPLLSDDVWRYLFEGTALLSGHNPFISAPAALHTLAPDLASRVNHPELTSIYPPAALLWFQLVALYGSPIAAQLGSALLDCATAFVLARSGIRRGLGSWPGVAWALHPLPALESASNAHLEPIACLALVLAMSQSERARGAWLVMAAGVKLLPILFLPSWIRQRPSKASWQRAAVASGAMLVLALPVLGAGPAMFDSLGTYARHWSFNSLGMTVVQPVAGEHARFILMGAGALGTIAILTWRKQLPRVALGIATVFLCTSPTVHPWYALWALAPALWLGQRAWLYGATGMLASYAVLSTWEPLSGSWTEPSWLLLFSWGWFLVAWPWEQLRARASQND